jgi:hypothetical protein
MAVLEDQQLLKEPTEQSEGYSTSPKSRLLVSPKAWLLMLEGARSRVQGRLRLIQEIMIRGFEDLELRNDNLSPFRLRGWNAHRLGPSFARLRAFAHFKPASTVIFKGSSGGNSMG